MNRKCSIGRKIVIALALLACLGLHSRGRCAEALKSRYDSEWIALATYVGHGRPVSRTDHTVGAEYSVYRILKGPPVGRTLIIRFDPYDPKERTEIQKKYPSRPAFPEKGSRWILFIPYCFPHNGMYETFQGASGRLECNEQNLLEVERDVPKQNPNSR